MLYLPFYRDFVLFSIMRCWNATLEGVTKYLIFRPSHGLCYGIQYQNFYDTMITLKLIVNRPSLIYGCRNIQPIDKNVFHYLFTKFGQNKILFCQLTTYFGRGRALDLLPPLHKIKTQIHQRPKGIICSKFSSNNVVPTHFESNSLFIQILRINLLAYRNYNISGYKNRKTFLALTRILNPVLLLSNSCTKRVRLIVLPKVIVRLHKDLS